jgi:hypothetical protein
LFWQIYFSSDNISYKWRLQPFNFTPQAGDCALCIACGQGFAIGLSASGRLRRPFARYRKTWGLLAPTPTASDALASIQTRIYDPVQRR